MAAPNLALLTCVVAALATGPARSVEPIDSGDFFNAMCYVLGNEPTFPHDALYDVWMNDLNWNTREVPFDLMAIIKVTKKDVKRYRRDMGPLLVRQPPWRNATAILVSQQQSRVQRKTMLFPHRARPGRYFGVPNSREANPVARIPKKSIHLINLQMLLLLKSTYLIIMDCDTGETSLSHRDSLAPVYAPIVYQVALRVPFPVRYSWMYTGEKIPDIPADHPPEPLFV